jgi:hypothetical protein
MVTAIVTGMTIPATSEELQSRRNRKGCQNQTNKDRVVNTDDCFPDEFGLIIKRNQMNTHGESIADGCLADLKDKL